MPNPSPFGRRLKEAREMRSWTQADLAERSDVPAMMISHYETGTRGTPSLITLQRLADALDVAIEWLLGRVDDNTPLAGPLAALFRSASVQKGQRLDEIKRIVGLMVDEDIKKGKKK